MSRVLKSDKFVRDKIFLMINFFIHVVAPSSSGAGPEGGRGRGRDTETGGGGERGRRVRGGRMGEGERKRET